MEVTAYTPAQGQTWVEGFIDARKPGSFHAYPFACQRAKGHFPVPGVDRLAFPPRSFDKEAAAEAEAKRHEYEENRNKLIEGLKSQDPEVLEMERRNDLEDPLTREAMGTIKPKATKP